MKINLSTLGLAALLLVVAGTTMSFSQTITAKAEDARKFVGTWRLVSRVDRLATGQDFIEPSLGTDPLGYLLYDATGHIAVQLMRQNRTSAEVQTPSTSPQAPNATIFSLNGYEAYFGTYTVNESNHSVTHHVEGALIPADVGKDLVRNYSFQGDRLTLSLPVVESDGAQATRTLVWERVK